MAFTVSKLKSLLRTDLGKLEHRSILGLDVGSSSIKIVQLHDENGVPTLDTYGELQLGPYASIDVGRSTYLPIEKLTEALVDIIRESGAASKRIAVAISFNASFITFVTVPTKKVEEIGPMMPVEARKYIPTSLTEMTLDWFPVGDGGDGTSTKVLLAAIHNEALRKLEAVVNAAGLKQQMVEIEVFSSMRSALLQNDDMVGIIDCGASTTKLYLVSKGSLVKTHSTRMNGVDLTNAISEALGLTFEEAEGYKRTVGLLGTNDDERGQKALTSVLERGFREIHTALRRFGEDEHLDVSKIILCGSGALLKGLDVYTHDMMSVPVVIADPFSKVAYPAFLEDTLRTAGPTFTAALGVALRGLSQG